MQILAIENELKPIPAELAGELLREEAARVWALKKQEVIREIWFTRVGRCAVVLLECDSEAEAERLLATLPLVRERYIEFEIRGLQAYNGFDRLIR
jgi:muconolactone delta-isomerase